MQKIQQTFLLKALSRTLLHFLKREMYYHILHHQQTANGQSQTISNRSATDHNIPPTVRNRPSPTGQPQTITYRQQSGTDHHQQVSHRRLHTANSAKRAKPCAVS